MKCSRARWQTPRGANLGEKGQGSNAWGERSLGSTAEDRMIASVLSQLNCHSIPKYKAWRWLGFHSPRQLPPHTLPTVVFLDVMFANDSLLWTKGTESYFMRTVFFFLLVFPNFTSCLESWNLFWRIWSVARMTRQLYLHNRFQTEGQLTVVNLMQGDVV